MTRPSLSLVAGAASLGVLATLRLLLACGPYPPLGVRFDAELGRLTVMEDPFQIGGGEDHDYLQRFAPALEEARRAALARPERRILLAELEAARGLEQSGDLTAAARRFQEILDAARLAYREHRPSGDVVTHALSVAQDRVDLYGVELDRETAAAYVAARDRFDAGDLAGCAAALDALAALPAGGGIAPHADYLRAALALREGRADAARPIFERLAGKKATSPKAPAALFTLARRLTQGEEAEDLYESLLERFPRHALADDALGELAVLRRRRGDVAGALQAYARIVTDYPQGDMAERARESLVAMAPEAVGLSKVPEEIEAVVALLRAYRGEAVPQAAGGDAAAGPTVALQVAAAGTFLPGEARYRLGALLFQRNDAPGAAAAFAQLQQDPSPSLRARALFMHGIAAGEPASFRRLIEEYPVHATADDALFLMGGGGVEGVALLRRIVRAYPHRDRLAAAARAVIASAGPAVADEVAGILREAGHEDRLLYADGVAVSYLPLMARYPESPLALHAFFKQCYLTARGRQQLLTEAAAPHGADWARQVSPYHDPVMDEMDAGAAGALRREQRATSQEEARAIVRFARGYLARTPQGTGAQLVELKLPMALYLDGRPEDALGRARQVLDTSGDDPLADEAAFVQVLALEELGRRDEAIEAARAFPARWGKSLFASATREHLALLLEDAGRRVEALKEYMDLGYESDARYFIDVLLTQEELADFLARYPDDPRGELVRHAMGVRALRDGDLGAARAAMEASAALASADAVPAPREHAPLDEVREPGEPVTRAPMTSPAREELAIEARKKLGVLEILEKAAPADPAAAYAAAALLYRDHRAFYCQPLWQEGRVEELKFLRMRSEDEAKRFMTYLLAHNVKLASRTRFREVAEGHPAAPEAPKALYMEALCDVALASYSTLDTGWFGRFAEDAPRLFLSVAERYPDSSLADDALYWAGKVTADEQVRIQSWGRLRELYPDGDAIHKMDAPPEPAGEPPVP